MSGTAAPAADTVRVERRGRLAEVTLDRPPLNVLDIAMLEVLDRELVGLEAEGATSAILLRGAGTSFCAGVDVADHGPDRVARMIGTFHRVVERLLACPVPVVAAVHGAALGGGCELALACDVVLLRDDARLGQPEIRLGVFPPAAAVLLPRLLGRQRAADLVLSGRIVRAEEAVRMGLASRAMPAEGFDDAVRDYAEGLAGLSDPVLRTAKRALRVGAEGGQAEAMARVERIYLDELMKLEDAHEGLAAFLEKRDPVWRGA